MKRNEETNNIMQHRNLSYQVLADKSFEATLFDLSLFNSTKISQSDFKKCTFKLTEWQGAQLEDTSFDNCNFQSADIKSIYCINIQFKDIIFDSANIKDCTFINCNFENCTFVEANLTENNFNNCVFNDIKLNALYGFLNIFNKVVFSNVEISGSFYFSYLDNSTFENNCVIDGYLMGYLYGLNNCKLNSVQYQLRNNAITYNQSSAITYAIKMYTDRYMLMNIGFTKLLNNNDDELEENILACLVYLLRSIKENIIVKSEELSFLRYIITIEYENSNISPYALLQYYNYLSLNQHYQINGINKKSVMLVNLLKNQIYLMFLQYLDKLKKIEEINCFGSKTITIFIRYNNKPDLSLVNILNSIENTGLNKKAELIKSDKGSYLEWISCVTEMLPYFQLLIDILGITIPIILYTKEKKKKTIYKENNKHEIKIIDSSNKMRISIDNISMMEKKIQPIIKIAQIEKMSLNNKNRGYTKKNITEITITLE